MDKAGERIKVEYDSVSDSVYFIFSRNEVVESDEVSEGIIVDYDSNKEIRGIEILAFSKRGLDLNRLVKLREDELVAEVASN